MPQRPDAEYEAYVHGRLPALRRLAYLLTGDDHQADDLVQEAITKVYVKWDKVRVTENIDAYVHSIVVRTFLDEKRRGWWRVRLSDALPDRPAPVDVLIDERTMLRAALAKVPPRQQAVLVLRFLCDRPVSEVAQILNCSEGTVKSQTSHGLSALRRLLGDRSPAVRRAAAAAFRVTAEGSHR